MSAATDPPANAPEDDETIAAEINGLYQSLGSEMTVEKLHELAAKAPKNPQEWHEFAMKELRAADTPHARWCALGKAATTAVNIGCDDEAEGYALELKGLIPDHVEDWNYGNAIHDHHLVLGCLCLKRGDAEAAKGHLLEAGRSPGSPQMNSFGPNMSLARDLLEAGHPEVVLQYFELCRRFWAMDRGKLDQWTEEVRAGRMPEFAGRLVY